MASASSPASCFTRYVCVAHPQGRATAGASMTTSAAARTIPPILRPFIPPPCSRWKVAVWTVTPSIFHGRDARPLALRLDFPLHLGNPVGLVHVDEGGLEVRQLLLVVCAEGGDDHQVPLAHL